MGIGVLNQGPQMEIRVLVEVFNLNYQMGTGNDNWGEGKLIIILIEIRIFLRLKKFVEGKKFIR